MIFLTVGTLFPFDRLIKAVDKAIEIGLIRENVFAQVNRTNFKPKYMKYVKDLDKETFEEKIKESSHLISHAGVGSIIMAMKYNKPILVMPRMKKYHEHINDHQIGIAKKFEELNHILVAYDEDELIEKIQILQTFIPIPRQAEPQAVAQRIKQFLNQLSNE